MTNIICKRDKIIGSMVGGAAGDALGYPIEFMTDEEIFTMYENGLQEYVPDRETGKALISDDTQMSLFTANAVLLGDTRLNMRGIGGIPHDYCRHTYKDWLYTQNHTYADFANNNEFFSSWLMNVPELYSSRAPGLTCLNQIESNNFGSVNYHCNNSKGCGGIMRIAPIALYYDTNKIPIDKIAMECAEASALTHGHPLGYIPSAMLGYILSTIVYSSEDKTLKQIIIKSLEKTTASFENDKYIKDFNNLISLAIDLSENNYSDLENINKLGEGWVAEETLAIAVYCSLKYQNDFSKGIISAVNHSGDSDSTGAVTGNILGAWLGINNIENKWKENLELIEIIEEIAEDIFNGCPVSEYGDNSSAEQRRWMKKYIEGKYENARI